MYYYYDSLCCNAYRVGPRQQVQLEYINAVESSLLQHPLVIYPHLEDAIPPEVTDLGSHVSHCHMLYVYRL